MGTLEQQDGLDLDHVPKEAIASLQKLARNWPDIQDPASMVLTELKGAMTNHIYECHWPGEEEGKGRKVLLRLYGKTSDILFKREDELKTFDFVSRKGQGPRLLARFSDGRIEEFLHAKTLTAADMRDPVISASIAVKMTEFHELELPRSHEPVLWSRLRDWTRDAIKRDPESAIDLRAIEQEIEELQSSIAGSADAVGFCHNDLQYGNIMLDDADNSLTLIDYEYAGYNPVAFDIANHFCEMAADYHTDTPHILDFSKYPDKSERTRFVEAYLTVSSGKTVTRDDVEDLLKQVDRYELASHLHWGLWGTISASISNIDFDYKEYAKQRFQRYYERKNAIDL